MSNIVEDGFDEILRQRLAECEAATVERAIALIECRCDAKDLKYLAAAIRALSPGSADWLKRKELEAQERKLNQLLDAWKKQVLPEKYLLGWLEIQRNEVIREREGLDRQLKALGTVPK